MELVFQEQKLEYLHRIFCETVTQEQTADVVIPDSLADAERVVEAFGTLLVRSEECMADSVSVSGVVQAGVLFCGESGEVLQVESQIPFSMRRELPVLQRRGQIRFFVPGEKLTIFEEDTRRLLQICPAFRRDHDIDRHNNGITVVVLKDRKG